MDSRRFAAAAIALACTSAGVQAQQVVDAVPSGWRLQTYVPNNVVLWYTGSVCPNGQLAFRPTATDKDKDRLWITVLTGKAAQKRVVVYYTQEGTSCWIDSFLAKEE
jgi:hypothetical protein